MTDITSLGGTGTGTGTGTTRHPVLGTSKFRPDDVAGADSVLSTYLEAGGRALDTARVYGPSEDVLGTLLRAAGEVPELLVIGKGGHPDKQTWSTRLSREELLDDARVSVAALGRPLDLYLLHRDDTTVPVEGIADALLAVRDEGLTTSVGVSNWTAPRISLLAAALATRGLRLDAVSNYFGLAVASATPSWPDQVSLDTPTLRWLEDHSVPNIAWSSQSVGYFAGVYRGSQFDGAENERRRDALNRVADEAGIASSALLARWSAAASPQVIPVISSRSALRITATLQAMQDASLDAAVARLRSTIDPEGALGATLISPSAIW